eukprot:766454-Hanusia_phi.AAC.4
MTYKGWGTRDEEAGSRGGGEASRRRDGEDGGGAGVGYKCQNVQRSEQEQKKSDGKQLNTSKRQQEGIIPRTRYMGGIMKGWKFVYEEGGDIDDENKLNMKAGR